MKHLAILVGGLAAALLLTGCPSADPLQQPVPPTLADHEDALRIKPEAASKYVRLSYTGANRDGRTLRGVVNNIVITTDGHGNGIDTVIVFTDIRNARDLGARIAIPIGDVQLLPDLYPDMQTDELNGINLVESYHVTKQIPTIREVPIEYLHCEEPVDSVVKEDTCDCEPFIVDLDLGLACYEREYTHLAIAGLLRGSIFTDGNETVSEGTIGFGVDALIGYRFGPQKRWMAGVTFSTGIATVNAGEITPDLTSLDGLATTLRPLVLLTGRYYFAGLEPLPKPPPVTIPPPDTSIRFVDGRPLKCPEPEDTTATRDTTAKKDRDTTLLAGAMQDYPRNKPAAQDTADCPDCAPCPDCPQLDTQPCEEDLRVTVYALRRQLDSVQALQDYDAPVRGLFGCIKPYVYGELGAAFDARTQASLAMSLDATCNDCVAALREANADGSLGVDWSLPVSFGFGAGIDIPISSSLDIEIDLGYRNIAVGDAYQLLGFSNVPDTRRINSFQLRLGVIY